MKQNEKSNGSLRERWAERWAERLAGPASAEEMRMWPCHAPRLNLRAGIPPAGSGARQPGSGQFAQFGQNEPVPDAGKTHAKKTTVRKSAWKSAGKSAQTRRLRGLSFEDYEHKRAVPKISAVSRRRLSRSPLGRPRTPCLCAAT